MISTIDETELARLEYLIEASESCGYSTKSDDPNMQYLAAACHYTPALVAEVRRLREALNKEHRAWQCAEGRGDGLEMENAVLREKVEAWEWCNQVQHIYDNISFVLGLRQCAINELYTTLTAAREAVHADRE